MFIGSGSGGPIGTQTINGSWSLDVEQDLSSYTIIAKLSASLFTVIGNTIQLVIRAPQSGGTLNGVYISNVATSGDAYDADASPTAFTWDTSTSLAMSAGELHYSDLIAFPFNISAKLIAFNLSTTTYVSKGYLEDVIMYYKTGVQEADDAARGASYSYYGSTIPFIYQLNVSP